MRQLDDSFFAVALQRIRFHESTQKDIEMLNSRIGASLQCSIFISIVVRRHNLREALNKKRLQVISQAFDVSITHCLANIMSRIKMFLLKVYNIKGDQLKVKKDEILSVISEASLMITDNIDILLKLINDVIVEFYDFANSDETLIRDEIIVTSSAYMLIKLNHDVSVEIALSELSPSVIGIESISITYKIGFRKVMTCSQFLITLVYAI